MDCIRVNHVTYSLELFTCPSRNMTQSLNLRRHLDLCNHFCLQVTLSSEKEIAVSSVGTDMHCTDMYYIYDTQLSPEYKTVPGRLLQRRTTCPVPFSNTYYVFTWAVIIIFCNFHVFNYLLELFPKFKLCVQIYLHIYIQIQHTYTYFYIYLYTLSVGKLNTPRSNKHN